MQSNDPKLGLLSNQFNSKYQDSQQENIGFELQDFGDDQDENAFDNPRIQNKDVALTNLDQEPVTMLKKSQSSNLRQGQSDQFIQQNQLQSQSLNQQQIPQNQRSNINPNPPLHQTQTLSAIQFGQNSTNSISQAQIGTADRTNQIQSTCMFCQIPQLIPKNKNAFRCYNCNQINKVVFAYFICGSCRVPVMYQQGISNLISCTNCFTMNYVQQSNLPNTFQQNMFQTNSLQILVNQTQTIPIPQNQQQQVQGSQQQQQRNQVSELEAEFKELIN